MSKVVPITVAFGDGIGPFITEATLDIIQAAGANISLDEVVVGEKSYLAGYTSGIADQDWDTIFKNRVFLKAPITTPQGSGYKSLNVTIRKALNLYANVRPCRAFAPFVQTNFPKLDLTIIRENEEDLYAGVEYQPMPTVVNSIKVITKAGCERIVRYAFDYAVKNGRKKVTCMTKDNIMKMADGMFHSIFDSIAKEYPQIETDHYIIDIGAARLAARPEIFDVIVTLNLYGDIISDVVAEVSGSVGLAGSGNIGLKYSMFEAIHGSAPAMQDKKAANPSGILSGAIMMLAHIGQGSVATRVQNALLKTIEDGIATKDFYREGNSAKLVNTADFAKAVIANLGNEPKTFITQKYADFDFNTDVSGEQISTVVSQSVKQDVVGVDFYIACTKESMQFYNDISKFGFGNLKFQMMSFRGMMFDHETQFAKGTVADYWRCRFISKGTSQSEILSLASKLNEAGYAIASMYTLCNYNDVRGFTLAQGQ
jgi:isocitrate dehydrogenase